MDDEDIKEQSNGLSLVFNQKNKFITNITNMNQYDKEDCLIIMVVFMKWTHIMC